MAVFLAAWLITVHVSPAVAASPPADEPTFAQVDSGKVRGAAAGNVIAFKGIPFAEPPIGPLRWRPPQPVKPWDGVRDATAFGHDPMQPPSRFVLTSPSEDCLYLNVWRPATLGDKPLPVLVWIYGGGLVRGGSSMYPGDALARQGVVVVTFNYRLGRLGFFAHPALAAEAPSDLRGNFGYMDQLAALQWVQRNIAAFGGDSKNVTIAGESAGGGSVLVMLTSPLAQGLFQRAIVESAGIPCARATVGPMRSLAAAQTIAVDYAGSLGIKGEDKAALDGLRTLPAETLVKDTGNYVAAIFSGPDIPGLSHSIIDGKLVVEAPELTLRAGKQAMVPVLVGANDADLATSRAQTKDELFATLGPLAPRARKVYDPGDKLNVKELVQAVVADEAMIEPSRHLAELMTKAGQSAYFYRFAYVAESQRGKVPGATHGQEIPYAFDVAAPFLLGQATKADLAMAHTMSGYWVSFIKTGDPNGEGRPNWPRYDAATENVMSFTNTGITSGPDPIKDRLDLWRDVWEPPR